MKPKACVACDQSAFEKMRKIAPTFLGAQRVRAREPAPRPLPDEVGFKLTNQCNLRCNHCYQWNKDGHHHDLARLEQLQHLPFHLFAEVLSATRAVGSNIFLWGGEPLLYQHWNELTDLLERDPRWTSVCTNGILIEERLDSLLKISQRLELNIALDGLEPHHDAVRGQGAFKKTLDGINCLLRLKRRGQYQGEITVNCVITDSLVPDVLKTVEFWNETGIDAVYLGMLWYLSDETSSAMDRYIEQNQPWEPASPTNENSRPSWHAFKYRLSPHLAEPLLAQLDRVNKKSWKIKVRYNPRLHPRDIREFISGIPRPAAGKSQCLAVLSRMDVLPSGDVVTCKFFPESRVGNLRDHPTPMLWHGAPFQRLRETIDRCGLMPACSKCSLLYSRGV